MAEQNVSLDYTARDFDAIVAELLRQAEQVMPEWTSRGEGDPGMMLVRLKAYAAELNNYYIDRAVGESVLATATTRAAVLALAEQVGYITHGTIPATGSITFATDPGGPAVTVPKGTQLLSDYVAAVDQPVTFETDADLLVPAAGGTAVAAITQGVTIAPFEAGSGTGSSGQSLVLATPGVIEGSVRIWVEAPHANIEWIRKSRLIQAAPTERVFTTRLRADGATIVMFGNGANGAIPELGATIYASYRVGVGKAGNLPASKILHLATSGLIGVQIATDASGKPISTATTGGADPEGNDEIRRNAPQAFAAQYRCVTKDDFSRAALEVPGVSAANTVAARPQSVTVFVTGPDRTTPNAQLLDTATAHLNARALAGTVVSVQGPTFVPVNFGTDALPVKVWVAPGWRDIHVKAAVQAALAGLFKDDAVTFGVRVTLSQVYSAVATLSGVLNVNIPVMARADTAQSGADDAVMALFEMPVLGTVKIVTSGGVIAPV
ncbi:baseplate J/gp47 family protein [Nonomuraea typhae]|uniref:baseplate J/gp47 family protein n=1 Tax=Nonomuraea typhae TaxID=2603600 RepID=UPI0012FC2756|nr:baseplate J/gp47 family protein [Nonomuraea typhae]